jgi:hypothetical protein
MERHEVGVRGNGAIMEEVAPGELIPREAGLSQRGGGDIAVRQVEGRHENAYVVRTRTDSPVFSYRKSGLAVLPPASSALLPVV